MTRMVIELTHSFMGVDVTEGQFLRLEEAWKTREDMENAKHEYDIGYLSRNLSDVTMSRMILDSVCVVMELNIEDVTGKSRVHRFVLARQIASFMMKSYTEMINIAIAELVGFRSALGNLDHSSVFHSTKKIETYLDVKDREVIKWMGLINKEILKRLK